MVSKPIGFRHVLHDVAAFVSTLESASIGDLLTHLALDAVQLNNRAVVPQLARLSGDISQPMSRSGITNVYQLKIERVSQFFGDRGQEVLRILAAAEPLDWIVDEASRQSREHLRSGGG